MATWVPTPDEYPYYTWFNLDHAHRIEIKSQVKDPNKAEVVAYYGRSNVAIVYKAERWTEAVNWLAEKIGPSE